jgi:hypothetical protein
MCVFAGCSQLRLIYDSSFFVGCCQSSADVYMQSSAGQSFLFGFDVVSAGIWNAVHFGHPGV